MATNMFSEKLEKDKQRAEAKAKAEETKAKTKEETSVEDKPVPKKDYGTKNKKNVSLLIDRDVYEESKEMAKMLDRNFSNYVTHALNRANEDYKYEIEQRRKKRQLLDE